MSSAARRGRVPRRLPPGAGLASACARLWLPPQPPARPCSGSGADGSSGPQRTAQPQPPQHTVVTRSARGRNGAGRTKNARPRQLWGPRAVIASYSPSQVSTYLYLRICISICRKLRVASHMYVCSHMQPCCQEAVASAKFWRRRRSLGKRTTANTRQSHARAEASDARGAAGAIRSGWQARRLPERHLVRRVQPVQVRAILCR